MKIGIDIDGVLANFTDSYADLLTKETGLKFPPASSEWPTEWYWDRGGMKAAGIPDAVAKAAEKSAWETVKNTTFWYHLKTWDTGYNAIRLLNELRVKGHQIYFITTRPGVFAKLDTEMWFKRFGFNTPTVLIAGNEKAKGQLAAGLGLDAFIDDKPENCEQVVAATRILHGEDAQGGFLINHVEYPCQVFLVDQPYNRSFASPHIVRIGSALEALNLLMESSVVAKAA